jgi:hypothetical protein
MQKKKNMERMHLAVLEEQVYLGAKATHKQLSWGSDFILLDTALR